MGFIEKHFVVVGLQYREENVLSLSYENDKCNYFADLYISMRSDEVVTAPVMASNAPKNAAAAPVKASAAPKKKKTGTGLIIGGALLLFAGFVNLPNGVPGVVLLLIGGALLYFGIKKKKESKKEG